MSLEDIFDEEFNTSKYTDRPSEYNGGEKLVKEIEAEYTGENTERLERVREQENLREEIMKTENKLRKIKNPKGIGSGSRRAEVFAQVNERRNKLRNKLSRMRVRLDELAIESGQPLDSEIKEQRRKEKEKRRLEEREEKMKNLRNPSGFRALYTPYNDDIPEPDKITTEFPLQT